MFTGDFFTQNILAFAFYTDFPRGEPRSDCPGGLAVECPQSAQCLND